MILHLSQSTGWRFYVGAERTMKIKQDTLGKILT